MKTIIRKIEMNRGKARLWIEGDSLQSMGWTKGKRYDVSFKGDQIELTACDNGKRKIAGTDSRPIIDINTDKLRQSVGNAETVTVTVWQDQILIK